MPRLNQIQCRFVPLEDRVLLRVNTTDHDEFRFWMTRRFLRLLWPVVSRMLAATPAVKNVSDRHSRQTILAFQHETVLNQSDFSRPFEDSGYRRPLGDAPLLLARIQLKQADSGNPILCLYPEHGDGVEITLDPKLLHGFARLLADAAGKAEWDLPPLFEAPAASPPEQVVVN